MLILQLNIYKITNAFIIMICSVVVFILITIPAAAQKTLPNKYGLHIVSNSVYLKSQVNNNPNNAMLDIKKHIPGIVTDLKYCGTDNFMKQKLYPKTHTTYLRKPAVLALATVQQKLNKKGYALKIWDAYRPYSVTEKMWEPVKDDRYAADPKFGSGHNRGIAVDLTIVDTTTGRELDMGTGFDHFSDTAHADFKQLPESVLQNRLLLRSLMEESGFKILDTEWWHFYLPEAKKYDLLNLSFKQLQRLNRSL